MGPEKKFENDLIAALQKAGAFAHHLDAVGCDGWPDVVVLMDNRCCLVECKYHTMALRKEQSSFHIVLGEIARFRKITTATRWRDGTYTFQPYSGDGREVATLSGLVHAILEFLHG